MLTLATRLKNLAFALIGTVVVAYIALNYADLGRFAGLQGYYTVTAELAETGGLTTNADVTYRGVSVGRVGALTLTGDGVLAHLHIHDGTRIPSATRVTVADKSAVGEEYVDLVPTAAGAPYLRGGSRIPRAATGTPAPVTDVLGSLNTLASSIPLDALRTVVDETGTAFSGQSGNMQALLDNLSAFTATAAEHVDPTLRLITDSGTVLRTQADESAALGSFSRDARLLAAQLRTSDPDFRKVIALAPAAAGEFGALLHDLDPRLSVLLANLLTTSDVLLARVDGLEQLLVEVPRAVANGYAVVDPAANRLRFGLVTTFFDPLPCTSGYGGTAYRSGLDRTAGTFNTGARCGLPASSGVDVRGSANAPKAR